MQNHDWRSYVRPAPLSGGITPAVTPTGELRALTLHDVVPAGHIAIPVLHDRWSPHVRAGEFAVLDPTDTEPQPGELYALTVECPRLPRGSFIAIVQPYRSPAFGSDDRAVMYRFGEARGSGADGPLRREWWDRKCRGRVVGLLSIVNHEGCHD